MRQAKGATVRCEGKRTKMRAHTLGALGGPGAGGSQPRPCWRAARPAGTWTATQRAARGRREAALTEGGRQSRWAREPF